MANQEFITLALLESDRYETIPISLNTNTVSDVIERASVLFGIQRNINLLKDGKTLQSTIKLNEAGIANGDLLVVQLVKSSTASGQQQSQAAATATPSGGGLDFSNLLAPQQSQTAAVAPSGGGLDFSNLLASTGINSGVGVGGQEQGNLLSVATRMAMNTSSEPIYYNGMTLHEATQHNPHPEAMVSLLLEHEHLLKELNYHNPILANKLRNQPKSRAVQIWRELEIKNGIRGAYNRNQKVMKEQKYRKALQSNPNDEEAKHYFAEQKRLLEVDESYRKMNEEYPESLGNVLMLYVQAEINGHSIQAFVDSGAQTTIMSKESCEKCNIFHLLDTRFAGTAVGVGTGKILGRIHYVQLQLGGHYHFPCTVTVMEDAKSGAGSNMDFLLGLDMLRRHTCSIDLERGVLKFRLGIGQYMETPFLHEKDLDASKGGTKGFDAEKANKEILEREKKFFDGEDNMKD